MPKRMEVYKCEICGNIVEVTHGGAGQLVCCGKPMVAMEEKTADKTTEKHVPVIEKVTGGYRVTVGSTLHPMVPEHYIEWIELISDDNVFRKYLQPGDDPVVVFQSGYFDRVEAREYCSVHGLWKGAEDA